MNNINEEPVSNKDTDNSNNQKKQSVSKEKNIIKENHKKNDIINENESKKLNKFNNLSEPTLVNNNSNELFPKFNIKENKERMEDLNDYYSSHEYDNKDTIQKNMLTINDLIGPDINKELTLDIINESFNNFYPGKVSTKSYGYIKAYAANTNQGISRNYNEDRVSIMINITQPSTYKGDIPWPNISYFSVFDGHGGNKCAEFLRDNLLRLICNNCFFPEHIEEAIKYGLEEVDKLFLEKCVNNGEIIDNSGSCALIVLIINSKIYIANVGDSRCLISMQNGLIKRDVTRDHKPNYPYEKERILKNGGKIYQTKSLLQNDNNETIPKLNNKENNLFLIGPFRVFPGSLSVSRTIGDPAAKLPNFGGNPKVVVSSPDIYCFDLEKNDIDFLILGCDGIYDHMSSKDVFKCAWMMIDSYRNYNILKDKKNKENKKNEVSDNEEEDDEKIDLYNTCSDIVDFILKASMSRKSLDNVTCVIVAFKDLLNSNDLNKKNSHFHSRLEIRNNDIIEENSINYYTEKNYKKLPKIISNKNNKSLEAHQLSDFLKNDNNDINKKVKIQKKIFGNKIQICGIKKRDVTEISNIENNINKNIKLYYNLKENINKKNGELSQRIGNNSFLNELKFKNNDNNNNNNNDINNINNYNNNNNNIKKISLSTKKYKLDENNINNNNINNNNIIKFNNIINNDKQINNYNLLNYTNVDRNLSKKNRRWKTTKKIFLNNKIKPLFIDNNNINTIQGINDKNKLMHNLQLKLITNPNDNLKRNNNEEGTLTKTLSHTRDINLYSNKKEKDLTIFSNNTPQMTSSNLNTLNTLNTINSKPNEKHKITLNYLSPSPFQKNRNNFELKLKTLNKKSISFYHNNNLMNNLKLVNDKNLYTKNKQFQNSEYDLINFNSINGTNSPLDINRKRNIASKYRISSEDRYKIKNEKLIIRNPINLMNNIMKDNIFNKNYQKLIINNNNFGKKLIHNLTEDIQSPEKDNKLIIPNINQNNNK